MPGLKYSGRRLHTTALRFVASKHHNIQNLKELMKLVELDQIKYELTDKAENLKELGESL